ncbi:MAG TPA: diacylglycerol kinase family protein [Candidatus Saccharimonadales bacterium]|nr:diacylglycerol kinase family protein [Candidatus Saccharimonadales bacterium]
MYYYILESPQSRAVRQNYQKLRDILTNMSIVGEVVSASPARTPEELAMMGMSKGYSTIVAVGGDHHINQIATAVVGRAALGIIPMGATPLVTDIIGTDDVREAAEILKHRRLTEQSTVLVEPETLLFLDGEINSPTLAKASLVVDNRVRAHAYFNKLTVNRFLEVKLESTHKMETKKLFGIFGQAPREVKSESLFHGKNIRIVTDPILPLTVTGEPVEQTPLQLRVIPESLKVITKRGTFLE